MRKKSKQKKLQDRKDKNLSILIFSSLEEENDYETERRKKMTPAMRMKRFALLQSRRWGENWTKRHIERVVKVEMRLDDE